MPPISTNAPKSISVLTVPWMTWPSWMEAKAASRRSLFFLLEHNAAIDDDVVFLDIEFRDLAANLLPDKFLHVRHIACAASRCRHECPRADIDAQTALHLLDHTSADDAAFRESFLQAAPILGTLGLNGGKCVVLAAATGQRDRDRVAWLDDDRARVVAEVLRGDNAFGLAADIHDNIVFVNGDNGSLQRLTGRVMRRVLVLLLFELGEDIAERRFILRGWVDPQRRHRLGWAAS